MSKKPTLEELRNQHYFDIPALAASAGVNITVVYWMLVRLPVQRYQAELVLSVLSNETGEDYSLDTVDIVLAPEEDQEHKDLAH